MKNITDADNTHGKKKMKIIRQSWENRKELTKLNELMSKSHQLFRGIKHNAFT